MPRTQERVRSPQNLTNNETLPQEPTRSEYLSDSKIELNMSRSTSEMPITFRLGHQQTHEGLIEPGANYGIIDLDKFPIENGKRMFKGHEFDPTDRFLVIDHAQNNLNALTGIVPIHAGESTILGRSDERSRDQFPDMDAATSREHLSIAWDADSNVLSLKDLRSLNGTTLEISSDIDKIEATDVIEQNPEARIDRANRAKDVEIFKKSYGVSRAINEAGVRVMKAYESFRAKRDNLLDTPGKLYSKFRHTRAEAKSGKKQAKYDDLLSEIKTYQIAERSTMSEALKRSRIKSLENRAAKAKSKLERAKTHAQDKKDVFDARVKTMDARTQSVHDNANRRRSENAQEIQQRREAHINKKTAAIGRKELRAELRDQGASRGEVRSILATVPQEHLMNVGRISATAGIREKQAQKATRTETKADSKEQSIGSSINKNNDRINESIKKSEQAKVTADTIRGTHLPEASKRVEELKAQLEALPDDDTDRDEAAEALRKAEDRLTLLTQRELPYWENEFMRSSTQTKELKQKHEDLKNNLLEQRKTAHRLSVEARERQQVATRNRQATTNAAREALQ